MCTSGVLNGFGEAVTVTDCGVKNNRPYNHRSSVGSKEYVVGRVPEARTTEPQNFKTSENGGLKTEGHTRGQSLGATELQMTEECRDLSLLGLNAIN